LVGLVEFTEFTGFIDLMGWVDVWVGGRAVGVGGKGAVLQCATPERRYRHNASIIKATRG
jgi:hypothetical protein